MMEVSEGRQFTARLPSELVDYMEMVARTRSMSVVEVLQFCLRVGLEILSDPVNAKSVVIFGSESDTEK